MKKIDYFFHFIFIQQYSTMEESKSKIVKQKIASVKMNVFEEIQQLDNKLYDELEQLNNKLYNELEQLDNKWFE
jgi:hypothetical protein